MLVLWFGILYNTMCVELGGVTTGSNDDTATDAKGLFGCSTASCQCRALPVPGPPQKTVARCCVRQRRGSRTLVAACCRKLDHVTPCWPQ